MDSNRNDATGPRQQQGACAYEGSAAILMAVINTAEFLVQKYIF